MIPVINQLLALPFALKIATKDHHPPNHVSFASNHPGSQPFVSFTTIVNPANPAEKYESRLWPDHCVVGTPGNELAPELHLSKVDKFVLKGRDPRVEMYSAFRSPLRDPPLKEAVSELESLLKEKDIKQVFVVGLAGDYCVKATAIDSAEIGWNTLIVEEGIRCVDRADWDDVKGELRAKGVEVTSLESVKQVSLPIYLVQAHVLAISHSR